ncbi:anthranilate synthase component I family protein [Aureibacillus halotolerans]|uniref:Aminodeoxychorismate synthase subunit I n=1 Tax=Aureibacillus halotolerans TaxID=1508390 RepID=A0A4R6TR73_9BACI|nr:anthranilate synthase component I family protein [Aureibacillus halotolerans]TDQ34207.1 aminodeoxychorismate synthase subunit I [Aureibacillus halotolerans]
MTASSFLRPYGVKKPLPQNWFQNVQQVLSSTRHSQWLESGKEGRWSFLAVHPFAIIEAKGKHFSIHHVTEETTETSMSDTLTGDLKQYMQQFSMTVPSGYPPFVGGAVGVCSYDTVLDFEPLVFQATDDLMLPDVYLLVTHEVMAIDHAKDEVWFIVNDTEAREERIKELETLWETPTNEKTDDFSDEIQYDEHTKQLSLNATRFSKAVEKVKDYIASGDSFQVNLSIRQERPIAATPLAVYRQLRELNPSPYMAFLQSPEFSLVCGSPELLVKTRQREVTTKPIAGTRSRGATPEEDAELANELLHHEKERAEHIMLVDLERNDLGKICTFGSVRADVLLSIERYSHVMHLVSEVAGTLEPGVDAVDTLKAVFPGGTITGAPKLRTMEIIDELEPVRRGFYTGSVGWIGFHGDMEMNIIIRSMLVKAKTAYVQSGAGIVSDSVPEWEFKEALKKAAAVWQAVERAEAELSE